MKVFLDMDGVLVDFINGACKAHGRINPYLDPSNARAKGEWCIDKLLGIDPAEFWQPLGFEFWSKLDWMPDGREILHHVEQKYGAMNVCLLTSPCDTEGCAEGKIAWIRQHMPEYRRRFFLGPPKEFAAGPSRLLIDDNDGNVQRFCDAGGDAILVPRPWNSSHMMDAIYRQNNYTPTQFARTIIG